MCDSWLKESNTGLTTVVWAGLSDESLCLSSLFFESEIRTSVFDGGRVRNKKMQEVHEGNDKIIIIILNTISFFFPCLSAAEEGEGGEGNE